MKRTARKLSSTLLLLLVAAGLIPFFYPWEKPLLSWRKLQQSVPSLHMEVSLPSLSGGGAQKPVEVYRWRNADGSWAFGDNPPQGVAYETLSLDPDSNLLPALPLEREGAQHTVPTPQQQADKEDSPATVYSPEEIADLSAAARLAREAMERRRAEEQAILEGR